MRTASTLLAALLVAAPAIALAQTTTTAPAKSMPAAPMAAPMAPATTAAGPGKSTTPPAAASAGSPAQYSSQGEATSKCSGDTVVWANPTSKALHTSTDRYFGKSKHGFYACEKEAMSDGYHMSGHHHKHAKSA